MNYFSFRRQHSLFEINYFMGLTDWHSHILPAVDDGIQLKEESYKILKEYEKLGISEVWLTPHIMEDIPNTTKELTQVFLELSADNHSSLKLHLASENMIDHILHIKLAVNDLLPIGNTGDYLLVETSYYTPPINFQETLEQIADKGYQPILAHPERYVYMEEDDYLQLRETGVLFQLNLMSLGGHYGKLAEKKSQKLLRLGCYDVAGSDLHNMNQISLMKQIKLSSQLINDLERIKENRL